MVQCNLQCHLIKLELVLGVFVSCSLALVVAGHHSFKRSASTNKNFTMFRWISTNQKEEGVNSLTKKTQ